uniref:INVERT_DEFENSINS domain-containing protein n=1 Tax=Parastrongyloides trichosuri TaxID=131310 RepID=A0A0N5A5V2_PARTI
MKSFVSFFIPYLLIASILLIKVKGCKVETDDNICKARCVAAGKSTGYCHRNALSLHEGLCECFDVPFKNII